MKKTEIMEFEKADFKEDGRYSKKKFEELLNKAGIELGKVYPQDVLQVSIYNYAGLKCQMIDFIGMNQVLCRISQGNYKRVNYTKIEKVEKI